jgi:uncharacterized heparinase superfamily protein
MIETLDRYWQTVRWLRPVQIYGRIWFRLRRPQVSAATLPVRSTRGQPWSSCDRPSSMVGARRFRFQNVEHSIDEAGDWNSREVSRLWTYHLHYFDDLVTRGAAERRDGLTQLLNRWIAENPPGHGPGWEPYPASLRIVNWIKWIWSDPAADPRLAASLAVQARYLSRRLEHHLLGNHLWANAKALVFAGTFFQSPESDRWLRRGLNLIEREIGEQILADGGHFEGSPMYHSIMLEDVLDLIQLASRRPELIDAAVLARWRDTAARMIRWLRVMTHPDGRIAQFNDAAFENSRELSSLADYASSLGVMFDSDSLNAVEVLNQSGYVRIERGPAVLIADVAPIGPDYQPGHGHADTLSFELSVGGVRAIVNGGTSTYDAGVERLRQRGTASHNTVEVDGVNSSEVWGSFRVARRARPFDVRFGTDGEVAWLSAAHDGYQRLPGRVTHRRRWALDSSALVITDRLEGAFREACGRFRLLPEASVRWEIQGARERTLVAAWHPSFGVELPARLLEVTPDGAEWQTRFEWDA